MSSYQLVQKEENIKSLGHVLRVRVSTNRGGSSVILVRRQQGEVGEIDGWRTADKGLHRTVYGSGEQLATLSDLM